MRHSRGGASVAHRDDLAPPHQWISFKLPRICPTTTHHIGLRRFRADCHLSHEDGQPHRITPCLWTATSESLSHYHRLSRRNFQRVPLRSGAATGPSPVPTKAAAVYALIATAELNDVNPQAWLADLRMITRSPGKAHPTRNWGRHRHRLTGQGRARHIRTAARRHRQQCQRSVSRRIPVAAIGARPFRFRRPCLEQGRL